MDNAQVHVTTALRTELRKIIAQDAVKGWEAAWTKGITPWDAGQAQPPLRDLIASGELPLPTTGRALVPGCGKGYDAVLIATTLGLDTIGMDISPTAIAAANEQLKSLAAPVKATFQLGDFFELAEADTYDLVYDYTFFVAIPPARRGEWATKMTQVVKPGGYLITLVFSIEPETDVGPPFYVRPEHHAALLDGTWEKVLDKVPEASLETHIGKERLVVWKKM